MPMTIMVHSGKIIQLYEAGKKSVWEEFDSHGNRVRCQYDFDLADRILNAKWMQLCHNTALKYSGKNIYGNQ